jgi:hypothetical protein
MAAMLVVSDQDLSDSPVLNRIEPGPCLRGPGDDVLWCGHCGELLLDGVAPDRVVDVVFRCACGAYNRPIL